MHVHWLTYPTSGIVDLEAVPLPEEQVKPEAEGDQQTRYTNISISKQTGWTSFNIIWKEYILHIREDRGGAE